MKGKKERNYVSDRGRGPFVVPARLAVLVLLTFLAIFLLTDAGSLDVSSTGKEFDHGPAPEIYFVLTVDGTLWSIGERGKIFWKSRILQEGTFYPSHIFPEKQHDKEFTGMGNRLYTSFQGRIFFGSTWASSHGSSSRTENTHERIFSEKSAILEDLIPIEGFSIADLVERCPFHSSLFPGLYMTGSRNSDVLTVDLFTGRIVSNSASSQHCEAYEREASLRPKPRVTFALGITTWRILAMNALTNRQEWSIRYSDLDGINNSRSESGSWIDGAHHLLKSGSDPDPAASTRAGVFFGSSRNFLYLKNASLGFKDMVSKVFVLREDVSLPYLPSSFYYLKELYVEHFTDLSNSAVGPLIGTSNNILLDEAAHRLPGVRLTELGLLISKKLKKLSPVATGLAKIVPRPPLLPLPVLQIEGSPPPPETESRLQNETEPDPQVSKIHSKSQTNPLPGPVPPQPSAGNGLHLSLATGLALFAINLVLLVILLRRRPANQAARTGLRDSFLESSRQNHHSRPHLHTHGAIPETEIEVIPSPIPDKNIRLSKSYSMIDMRTSFIGLSKNAFLRAFNHPHAATPDTAYHLRLDALAPRTSFEDDPGDPYKAERPVPLPDSASSVTNSFGATPQNAGSRAPASNPNTPGAPTEGPGASTPNSAASAGPKASSLYSIPPRCELARCIDNGRFSKNFEIVKLIGSGGFGQVYQVEHKLERGTFYAIKFLRLGIGANDDITRIRYFREITANRTTLSKHVVRYYTWWCEEPEALYNYVDGIESLGCSKSASHSSVRQKGIGSGRRRSGGRRGFGAGAKVGATSGSGSDSGSGSESDFDQFASRRRSKKVRSLGNRRNQRLVGSDQYNMNDASSAESFCFSEVNASDSDSCISRAPFEDEDEIPQAEQKPGFRRPWRREKTEKQIPTDFQRGPMKLVPPGPGGGKSFPSASSRRRPSFHPTYMQPRYQVPS